MKVDYEAFMEKFKNLLTHYKLNASQGGTNQKLLIDLKLEGKTIIVVGGGTEAYRKTQSFVDSGAKIWVVSREFSERHPKAWLKTKKVTLLKTEIKDAKAFLDSLNP